MNDVISKELCSLYYEVAAKVVKFGMGVLLARFYLKAANRMCQSPKVKGL